MAQKQLGANDVVLLGSLVYACVDLVSEWDSFDLCSRPIHKWLLTSYVCVIGFRLTHWLGSRAMAFAATALTTTAATNARAAAVAGELLLNLRHKDALPRVVAKLTWAVGVPFFTLWTVLGTYWFHQALTDTPECVPTAIHLYFSLFWIFLCYCWIVVHVGLGVVACVLERKVRRAEGNILEIEDDDARRRWGSAMQISGYEELVGGTPANGDGLDPAEIKGLPCENAQDGGLTDGEKECSICLNEFEPGDICRRLPKCSHAFHRSCIDLWLLRRADCPLCKTHVNAPSP